MFTVQCETRSLGWFDLNTFFLYSALDGGECWCLLIDAKLPAFTVVGAHLFKHEWSEYAQLLGMKDIDELGNGLPLWKPVEWAFDTSRSGFYCLISSLPIKCQSNARRLLVLALINVSEPNWELSAKSCIDWDKRGFRPLGSPVHCSCFFFLFVSVGGIRWW